jgi:hypothetical protein
MDFIESIGEADSAVPRHVPTASAIIQTMRSHTDALDRGAKVFGDADDEEAFAMALASVSGDEKVAVSFVLDALHLSPTELAEFLGVGVATLYAWVDPKRTMRPGPKRLGALEVWLRFAIHRLELVAEQVRWAAMHAEPVKRGGARKKKSRKEKGGN